jgi:hypothetical protein
MESSKFDLRDNRGINMFELRDPLVNSKVRLISTVQTCKYILPAGSILTVRYDDKRGCYLEDEKGKHIYDYFCLSNFQMVL